VTIKKRLSASVDAELLAAAERAVASGEAASVSAWVSDAFKLKIEHDQRLRGLGDFIEAYEAEFGEITEEDMRAADRWVRENAIHVSGNPKRRAAKR
jgi:hypothetical protein